MKIRSAVIPLLVVLSTPITARPVWAEERQATIGVSPASAAKLAPGDLVRVTLTNGPRVDGRVIAVATDVLRVRPTTRIAVPIRDLAFADINSIELRREGRSPGKKVLIAVVTGVSIVGGFGLLLIGSGGS